MFAASMVLNGVGFSFLHKVLSFLKIVIYYNFFFFQQYAQLFNGAGNNPGEKTLEDRFFEHEVI